MRIALTGATGLLGRNLLFEILKQNLDRLDDLEILILGRPQKSSPLDERLENIITDDGYAYLGLEKQTATDIRKKIDKCIIPISFDLTHEGLSLSQEDLKVLKRQKIDHFFHVAALTDFRSDSSVKVKLEEVNVKGTQRILKLLEDLDVKQLIYIGSAYSCGSKTGVVEPDYINIDEKFRNPYEKSKLEAEISVRDFAKKNKIKLKVFRPSTICGRLIEKPLGSINKFDVFYAWAGFLLRHKLKLLGAPQKLYSETVEFALRIQVNQMSGLNIVPVDYAAKILYGASVNGQSSGSYHIANIAECSHADYIKWMMESLNISGYSFVDQEPKDKGAFEKLYYRTVGKIFTPYIIDDPMHFNIDNLREINDKIGVSCPVIDKKNFMGLMSYAKQKNFGLKT